MPTDRCFVCVRHQMYRSAQREGWGELWPVWVKRWGKLKATDALIAAMADYEARYQDLRRLIPLLRKRKRQQ